MKQPLIVGLVRAVYWLDDALQDALAAQGIRLTRAESLVIANMMSGIRRGTHIARNLGVSRQATGQILASLESRGYVTSSPDPSDPRARLVNFSTTFRKHAPLCYRIIRASERELEQRIGKPAVDALRAALAIDWGPVPRLATAKSMPGASTSSNSKVKRRTALVARSR